VGTRATEVPLTTGLHRSPSVGLCRFALIERIRAPSAKAVSCQRQDQKSACCSRSLPDVLCFRGLGFAEKADIRLLWNTLALISI
jgi:hypothetical protein